MRIKGLAICPPPGAQNNPSVTPELLASSLARYSRSNKGIDTILSSIDWNDPDKSVDAIFRFVDYGHASITGMTGGIAMVVDQCSMFLAYKIFEIAQLCDGQESSTRYIKLDKTSLPNPEDIGIPEEFAKEWLSLMELSYNIYQDVYESLDRAAQKDSSIVRVPAGAGPKVIERLTKNYALDRSRYFIPFATKTNAAFVMSARVWADTIKQLDSLPLKEAKDCAAALRMELSKFVPRMTRHCEADEASRCQAEQSIDFAIRKICQNGAGVSLLCDQVCVELEKSTPSFLPQVQNIDDAFKGKINRYSSVGNAIRRKMVRAAWNNMAIAELRDLNRHRSGYRFSPLTPDGFYLPAGISHPQLEELLSRKKVFLEGIVKSKAAPCYIYGLFLGTQVPFEHSTHLDKFIYEIELRTGLGAHFRYAEHLTLAYKKLVEEIPELKEHILVGSAEPE
jgi:thymidylate synthase ThyX